MIAQHCCNSNSDHDPTGRVVVRSIPSLARSRPAPTPLACRAVEFDMVRMSGWSSIDGGVGH